MEDSHEAGYLRVRPKAAIGELLIPSDPKFPRSRMKASLSDPDGTLAAREVLKGRALARACTSYGANADRATYAEVMGEEWPAVAGHFFTTYQIAPSVNEFNERLRCFYLDLIDASIAETDGRMSLSCKAS
jgi:hypothetical protein